MKNSGQCEVTIPTNPEGTKIRVLSEKRENGDTFHVKITVTPALPRWKQWVIVHLLGWEVL